MMVGASSVESSAIQTESLNKFYANCEWKTLNYIKLKWIYDFAASINIIKVIIQKKLNTHEHGEV